MTGRRSTMQPYGILPAPTEGTAPYWEAARRGKLAIVQCQECGFYLHPSRYICVRCHAASPNLAYVELSGRGTLYSFVLHYETRFNGFADKLPYIAAVIELDEQPGLTVWGNVLDAEYEDLRLGLPVEAVWEPTDDPEIAMMQWRPAGVGLATGAGSATVGASATGAASVTVEASATGVASATRVGSVMGAGG